MFMAFSTYGQRVSRSLCSSGPVFGITWASITSSVPPASDKEAGVSIRMYCDQVLCERAVLW